jgi:hypothetical protein
MTRAEILDFVRRDWAAVEAAKAEDWAKRKASMAAGELLAAAESLRRSVARWRADWPSEADREADLAAHVELSRRLRSVRLGPGL